MDFLDEAVGGVFVALDDDGHVGRFGEERLDFSDDALDADAFAAVEDFVLGGDREEDRVALQRAGSADVGFVDGDAGFLDEDGGDDEEDEKNENTVDHRREIDVHFFFCLAEVSTEHVGSSRIGGFLESGGKDRAFEADEVGVDAVATGLDDEGDEEAGEGDGEAGLGGDEGLLHAIGDALHAGGAFSLREAGEHGEHADDGA